MTQRARVWRVVGHALTELPASKLDLELRLEDWIADDVGIVDDSLLVIGRQLETDFGGIIDLLCVDAAGDLVILELKRHKTPREIVAQTLDYASWVDSLSHERVARIAEEYLGHPLDEAFLQQFGEELPDSINAEHRMVIVASEIDQSSERIIEYLSTRHRVSINAATFQYFRDVDDGEILTRVFLLEPEDVDYRAKTKSDSKRKPNLTYEQLEAMADSQGVGDLYRYALSAFTPLFDGTRTTRSNVSFLASVSGNRNAVLNLIPRDSDPKSGLAFQIYASRARECFGLGEGDLTSALPPDVTSWEYYRDAPEAWRGFTGHFSDTAEIDGLRRCMSVSSPESASEMAL